jgi:hypothetical protein
MADNLTTQSATPATVPASTLIATIETAADGHLQRTIIGGGDDATITTVADSTSSVTLLAANVDRLGAMLYNDSPSPCAVKFGTTAGLSDFSVKMGPFSLYEIPYGHRGRLDGIWEFDGGGTMRVTELTS